VNPIPGRCLVFHTTFSGITPEEVHEIGLEEIAKLRKGVLEVAESVGEADATFSEFTKKGGWWFRLGAVYTCPIRHTNPTCIHGVWGFD
jgi:hypothetical protein